MHLCIQFHVSSSFLTLSLSLSLSVVFGPGCICKSANITHSVSFGLTKFSSLPSDDKNRISGFYSKALRKERGSGEDDRRSWKRERERERERERRKNVVNRKVWLEKKCYQFSNLFTNSAQTQIRLSCHSLFSFLSFSLPLSSVVVFRP